MSTITPVSKKKSIFEFKKVYDRLTERSEDEKGLVECLIKLYSSADVGKDAHFFGRAIGNAIEDALGEIIKMMERSKTDSRERRQAVEAILLTLGETLKSTKKLHKLRNGETE